MAGQMSEMYEENKAMRREVGALTAAIDRFIGAGSDRLSQLSQSTAAVGVGATIGCSSPALSQSASPNLRSSSRRSSSLSAVSISYLYHSQSLSIPLSLFLSLNSLSCCLSLSTLSFSHSRLSLSS